MFNEGNQFVSFVQVLFRQGSHINVSEKQYVNIRFEGFNKYSNLDIDNYLPIYYDQDHCINTKNQFDLRKFEFFIVDSIII